MLLSSQLSSLSGHCGIWKANEMAVCCCSIFAQWQSKTRVVTLIVLSSCGIMTCSSVCPSVRLQLKTSPSGCMQKKGRRWVRWGDLEIYKRWLCFCWRSSSEHRDLFLHPFPPLLPYLLPRASIETTRHMESTEAGTRPAKSTGEAVLFIFWVELY